MITGWAAILLSSGAAAKAETPQMLSALGGNADNRLISQIQASNPGTLCSLVPADGHARLMSYGNEAVVDLGGVPTLLSYHPDSDRHGAQFTGKAIKISGNLVRERVTGLYATVSHEVTVQVRAKGHTRNFEAQWTCQSGLPTVSVAH